MAAAVSADGRWLVASEITGDVRLWDLATPGGHELAVVLRGAAGELTSLAFTADANWLAAAGAESTVRLWNMDVHDLMNRATTIAAARKGSVAVRYAWLSPSHTIAGRVLLAQIEESQLTKLFNAAEQALPNFQERSTRFVAAATTRWSEIQLQLQSMPPTANSAPTGENAPIKVSAAIDSSPGKSIASNPVDKAKTPGGVNAAAVANPKTSAAPRTALQTNTLRIFVR